MKNSNPSHVNMNRRTVLIGQACAAVGAGSVLAQSTAVAMNAPMNRKPNWHTVTHNEMSAFYRDRVAGMSETGQALNLRLVGSEMINSGPARPKHLPRSEGVVVLFDSPDMDWFVENGAQNIVFNHKVLGHSTLYITPVPRTKGGHILELVLN